jgi:hypothetical protein
VCVCSLSHPACKADVAYLAELPYFFHITTYKAEFRENVIEHEMRVFIFSSTFSEIFLLLRRIKRDIIINVHTSLRKAPVIFVRF